MKSTIDTYFDQLDAVPLLSADEEKALARRIATGDREAREHLILANLRLVVKIARGYQGKGLPLEDLISEANIGLIRAAEKFDPAVGTRFSTYASYWIKQAITRALDEKSGPVRIPGYARTLLTHWRRTAAAMAVELGRPATPEEVGRRMGLPAGKIEIVERATEAIAVTFQDEQGGDGNSFAETLIARDEPEAEVATAEDEAETARRVRSLFGRMTDKEAVVIRLRFGMGGNAPLSISEAGKVIGTSRANVSHTHRRVIDRLKEEARVA